MQPIETNGSVGNFRTFITDGGVHSPETLAEITISQLIDPQSNPNTIAKIRAMLTDFYAGEQIMTRCLFNVVDEHIDNQTPERRAMCRLQITQLLAREISTLLDIERKTGA